jgi:methionyl-tRNA formyltransferase
MNMPATDLRLVMMGTGSFAEPTFRALLEGGHQVVGLVTQPDRPVGAQRGSTRQAGGGMKALAQERGLPILQPERINAPQEIARLRELRPDLLVVAAYGQILSKEVLTVPTQGGINVHASLLPKYRGAAPVAWAIYHGEKVTGVTIIKMSVALDAGDVLAQEAVEIGPEETAGELEMRLAVVGARLALRVIDQIAAGAAHGIKQDKSQATKAPKLKKEDGLIDWARSAGQICNHIRAMQPWPTAYTFLHRKGKTPSRVIIYKAKPPDVLHGERSSSWAHKPGDLLMDDPSHLYVVVGDEPELVEVLELQPAGKKRMSAAEFLRGHPLQPGDRFGPETL